tara:strand:- start:63 stop:284 length:222 start_codon:yes stop_codon:yes gene_type:complete
VEREQISVQIFQEYQTLEFMVVEVEGVMALELLQIVDQEQEELVEVDQVVEDQVAMEQQAQLTLAVVVAVVAK